MTIYLDYNATAPLRPEALSAMQPWFLQPANPSSTHQFGRAAKKQLEDSRKTIAETLSAWPNEVIFTASGTEANVLALRGFSQRRLLISAIEHSSIFKTAQYTHTGYIEVDARGIIQLTTLEKTLQETGEPTLVSVMLANNETGVIQPVADIAALCKQYGALLHCDAVQALGKIPVDFSLLGADMLTLSAHKCGGPLGAAALILKNTLSIQPLLTGGGQELGRRAGTENIAAIAGFSAAVQAATDLSFMQILQRWMHELETFLQAHGGVIHGANAPRLPNTLCVSMPGVSNEIQVIDFDLNGFAISAGSACSSGRIEMSHVLRAMGVDPALASSAIRISAGWNTSQAEPQAFGSAWLSLKNRLKR